MAYYETFQYAWVGYLLAAIMVYWSVWKISKYWENGDVKNYFRMVSAVVLFTPASHTELGTDALAPAFIVTLGELLTHGIQAAMKGLIPLLIGLLVGAIALALQVYINVKRLEKQK